MIFSCSVNIVESKVCYYRRLINIHKVISWFHVSDGNMLCVQVFRMGVGNEGLFNFFALKVLCWFVPRMLQLIAICNHNIALVYINVTYVEFCFWDFIFQATFVGAKRRRTFSIKSLRTLALLCAAVFIGSAFVVTDYKKVYINLWSVQVSVGAVLYMIYLIFMNSWYG